MSSTASLVGIVSASLLLSISAARAADPVPPPTDPRAAAQKSMDTNGDGVVSQEERMAARKAQMLKRFDTNGDGVLSDEERAAARAQAGKAQKRRMNRLDTNGDGKISEEERAAARARMTERQHKLLQKYDKNGDGKLDDSERAALRADRAKQGARNNPKTWAGKGMNPKAAPDANPAPDATTDR